MVNTNINLLQYKSYIFINYNIMESILFIMQLKQILSTVVVLFSLTCAWFYIRAIINSRILMQYIRIRFGYHNIYSYASRCSGAFWVVWTMECLFRNSSAKISYIKRLQLLDIIYFSISIVDLILSIKLQITFFILPSYDLLAIVKS